MNLEDLENRTASLWPFLDLDNKWKWCVVGEFKMGPYTVPDGYVTDLATIPWWSQNSVFNPYAPDTAIPSAGHDFLLDIIFLYPELIIGSLNEWDAAKIFYDKMLENKVAKWKCVLYYCFVVISLNNWHRGYKNG